MKALLARLLSEQGDVAVAAAVLDGIASVPRPEPLETVWTSPKRARRRGADDVGSGGADQRGALDGVCGDVLGIVGIGVRHGAGERRRPWGRGHCRRRSEDAERRPVDMLCRQLPGARLWTYALTDDSKYPPRQHAKLVVVDEKAAFVTSANFSDAAAKRNLECGLLSRDAGIARGIDAQLDTLRSTACWSTTEASGPGCIARVELLEDARVRAVGLFSGIGGLELGLAQRGHRDRAALRVLGARRDDAAPAFRGAASSATSGNSTRCLERRRRHGRVPVHGSEPGRPNRRHRRRRSPGSFARSSD